jgi:cullin-associated NEDD8-dissociated protein 1
MLSFGSAQNVCSTFNQDLCVYSSVGNLGGTGSFRTWSSDSCKVQAQVFADGSVGVIHDSQSTWNPPDVYGLQADSNINLRVNWAGNSYPKASGKCTAGCQVWKNTCICDVKVANNAVFTNASDIPSVEDVLRLLTIGAPALSMFDTGVYRQVHRNENSGLYIYSTAPGVFDMNTIFEVRSEGRRTQFFVNMRSMVRIGNNFMFRNPPNFMRHEERTLRDAEYEVDALLEHLLYHPNTAPFVADFMIKRFVTSNPSPAYINTVAQAFKSGKYSGIGSGKYGDMAATISAVLLDRDSLSVTVKSDFSFGKFREPLMKVMHVMRSLNLFVKDGNQANFADLNKLLGQEPYFAPSVFNFYQSEFRTSGAVENSGLFSPEGQILTTPRILRYLNGLISLVEFGTTSCFTTFGVSRFANCNLMKTGQVDPVAYNSGYLNYAAYFRGLSGPAIVDRLDVLLSGGRLSAERKQLLAGVYSSITPAPEALKNVIELFFSTPEFQISGTAPEFQVEPPKASKPRPIYDSSQYKAIVYIFLNGGMDSYNLIVPHSGCSGIDLYEQYEDIRTDAAVPKGSLLRISTPSWGTPQPCNQFGIHPSMPFLKSLYNSNETAFISNIGTLVEPMTKAEYIAQAKKRPIGLFAHNVQKSIIRRVDADSFTAKGVLGRISDHFTSRRRSVSSYSVCGTFASVLEGELGVSESQVIMNAESGIETFDKDDLKPNLRDHVLNLNRKSSPSIFADTWNDFLSSGISRSSDLKSVFDAADVSTDFDSLDSDIASQLKQVSTVIASRGTLKSSLDLFNVEMGGFDTHNSFTTFGDNMAVIDAALQAFVSEMKRQNIWDKVTVVVSSDFARTLGSNGHGTDHAWAGNTFFLGGSVKGGQILGKYPSSLAEDGDVNIGNGRLLPTTSWEALWNGVSQWLGIMDGDALNRILPNRANFLTGNNLFTKADMFDN